MPNKWYFFSGILIAVLASVIYLMPRAQAIDVAMAPDEFAMLQESLVNLDALIKERNKALYSQLSPSATDGDILKLREYLGAENTPLETLFKWRNGIKDNYGMLIPLGGLVSIDYAIMNREMIQTTPFMFPLAKNSFK